mmetsp:Transcript_4059/g.7806  ORF Transcript_4059/g.7806 Transcript_4059/m.7806 type:complete len:83 (+) Transcript_4059:470-718(+)
MALAASLWKREGHDGSPEVREYSFYQGTAMGRPSQIGVKVRTEAIDSETGNQINTENYKHMLTCSGLVSVIDQEDLNLTLAN